MRYAIDSLRRRKGRTVLSALGIGLATALVVLLLALSQGVESSAHRLAATSGVDLLLTSANTSLSSSAFPPIVGAHPLVPVVERSDPNVAAASPWLVDSLIFANGSLYAASNASPAGSSIPPAWGPTSSSSVGWIPGDNRGIEVPPVVLGAGFPVLDDPHYANGSYTGPSTHSVVLDQALAGVLHVHPGDLVWTSDVPVSGPNALASWFVNATPFRVAGVSGPFWLIPSALLAFFYLSELQQITHSATSSTDFASLVLVHLADASHPGSDRTTIARAFPGLTVLTVGDVLGSVEQVVDLYRTFGTLIGVAGVVVATLFTTTVLVMSVDERSREIALLRAVGFLPSWVAGTVFEESLYLAALGLLLGFPLGVLGAVGIDRFLRGIVVGLPAGFSFVSFDPTVVTGAIVEILAIGIAAAVLPTIRALRLPIASELRAP